MGGPFRFGYSKVDFWSKSGAPVSFGFAVGFPSEDLIMRGTCFWRVG